MEFKEYVVSIDIMSYFGTEILKINISFIKKQNNLKKKITLKN